MNKACIFCGVSFGSPSSRRAWVEIPTFPQALRRYTSPSSRRAWVEMQMLTSANDAYLVALLAEGVGRNERIVTIVWQLTGRPPRGGRG